MGKYNVTVYDKEKGFYFDKYQIESPNLKTAKKMADEYSKDTWNTITVEVVR